MTTPTPTQTPETDAKHVELGIEYSVMSASYYEMRKHARAMESRALAAEAKAPKVWAAETIKDAPEGEYMILSNKGWTGPWEQGILGLKPLNHVRDFFDDGGRAWENYRPFGPIPQPPPMKEGE